MRPEDYSGVVDVLARAVDAVFEATELAGALVLLDLTAVLVYFRCDRDL